MKFRNITILSIIFLFIIGCSNTPEPATLLRLGLDIHIKPTDHLWQVSLIGKSLSDSRQGKIGEYF